MSKTAGGVTTEFVGSLFESSGTRETQYIFLGSTRIASITQNQGNETLMYYHADHLGGTNVMTDYAGAVKEIIEYQPFGATARHDKLGTGDEVAHFYFTGHYTDEESNLICMGARYYDPSLGRFITADTIVQNPNNPQTFNRYSYTGNNPVNYTDPTGHFFGFIVAAIVKAVTAAATYVAANAAAIATGALVGGVVGGTASVAMGGNFWQGAAIGAIGGGVFAGLAPGLSILGDNVARGLTLGGAAGPLTPGAAAISNFGSAFLSGAGAGAASAAYSGTDVGNSALIGGAVAGGFSLLKSLDQSLTARMRRNSAKGKLNSEIPGLPRKGGSGKYGGTPLGGNRFDPYTKGGLSQWVNNPSPLGGLQGSTGKFLFFNYSGDSMWHKIVESYSGAHDFLNSWAYESGTGYIRDLSTVERTIGFFSNPLNVAIATPIAVPTGIHTYAPVAIQQSLNSVPTTLYGVNNFEQK